MPQSENQKLKILYVEKYFREYSDENHPITAGGIVDYLTDECGLQAERRSIYRDIKLLREVYGLDIDGGQGGRYRLLSREFDFDAKTEDPSEKLRAHGNGDDDFEMLTINLGEPHILAKLVDNRANHAVSM